MNPISAIQSALLDALAGDGELTALVGSNAIFDAPPKGRAMPYVAITRHDCRPHDGDLTPGWEHTLVLTVWRRPASRSAALAIADRITDAIAPANLSGSEIVATLARVTNTQTKFDTKTGAIRVILTARILSEPNPNA